MPWDRRPRRALARTLGRAALWLARSRYGGRLAQLVCAHAPFLLPTRRVLDAGAALVIRHPLPEFPGHVVIVPKAYAPSLCALVAEGRMDVVAAVLAAARLTAATVDGELLLSINLGGRQDVAQLHAHLVPLNRARILLDGTVWRAPLDLADPEHTLAQLAEATRAAGDCDPRIDGSVLLLGFTGATPELRASRGPHGARRHLLRDEGGVP